MIILRHRSAVHVIGLPLIGLMLLSGCVTAEGQATLAPLRPAIPAEKSPEQLGTNNQDDVAAEPSAPDTAPEPSVPTQRQPIRLPAVMRQHLQSGRPARQQQAIPLPLMK